jgi:hypothetical protein
LRTVTVSLIALTLSAPLLTRVALTLVALALVALLSLSLTALILIVLLSHGVSLSRHGGLIDGCKVYTPAAIGRMPASGRAAPDFRTKIVGAHHHVSLVIPPKHAVVDQGRDRARALRHGHIGACRDFRQTEAHAFDFVQPTDCVDGPMKRERSVHEDGRSKAETRFDLGIANSAAERSAPSRPDRLRLIIDGKTSMNDSPWYGWTSSHNHEAARRIQPHA